LVLSNPSGVSTFDHADSIAVSDALYGKHLGKYDQDDVWYSMQRLSSPLRQEFEIVMAAAKKIRQGVEFKWALFALAFAVALISLFIYWVTTLPRSGDSE
jgi:hypothetical protein